MTPAGTAEITTTPHPHPVLASSAVTEDSERCADCSHPLDAECGCPHFCQPATDACVMAIPDCYRCGKPAAAHASGFPCPAPDPWWNCPEHQTEILWTEAGDWEDRYECPAPQCSFGRWIG